MRGLDDYHLTDVVTSPTRRDIATVDDDPEAASYDQIQVVVVATLLDDCLAFRDFDELGAVREFFSESSIAAHDLLLLHGVDQVATSGVTLKTVDQSTQLNSLQNIIEDSSQSSAPTLTTKLWFLPVIGFVHSLRLAGEAELRR